MHREAVDRSAYGRGPVQAWDARLKVVLTVGALVLIAFGVRSPDRESWLRWTVLLLLVLGVLLHARLSLRTVLLRSVLVLPFVGFIAASALLEVVPGRAVGIPIGDRTLALAHDGPDRALLILARAWLSILVTLALGMTTPFPAILASLERARFPRGFLEVSALLYRYLWVVVEEGRRSLLARRLRVGSAMPWRGSARVLGALFARSLARAHRIEIALLLRSPTGGWPVGSPLAWSWADTVRLVIGSAVLLGVALGTGAIAGVLVAATGAGRVAW